MMEWNKDMDAAPRDGTWFWIYDEGDAISARWHDAFGEFVTSWREMTFAASYGGGTRCHSPDIVKPKWWHPCVLPSDDI